MKTKEIKNDELETVRIWSCCEDANGSVGCCTGSHVYKVEENEELAQLIPFTRLNSRPNQLEIVALDCEMVLC